MMFIAVGNPRNNFSGRIYHYDGESWTLFGVESSSVLEDIWVADSGEIFAVGDSILHFDGTVWTETTPPERSNTELGSRLKAVWGSSPTDVWAGGEDGFLIHFNGSEWEDHSLDEDGNIEDIWGRATNEVYLCGRLLIHTFDGQTWEPLNGPYAHSIWGNEEGVFFAVGSNGEVIRSDGNTWRDMNTGTNFQLTRIWGSSSGKMIAAGRYGKIIGYDGVEWKALCNGSATNLNGIWGSGPDNIYVVADYGITYQYDGNVWNEVPPRPPNVLQAIWGSSANDVFAVGNDGLICHFDGSVWWVQSYWEYDRFWGVWGSGPLDVYAIGSDRSVLHYDGAEWEADRNGD